MSDIPTPRADACLTFWDYKNLCEQLEQEGIELKAWKESALATSLPLQEIARELGLPLGLSIHDRILPAIQKLKAQLDEANQKLCINFDKLSATDQLREMSGMALTIQSLRTENADLRADLQRENDRLERNEKLEAENGLLNATIEMQAKVWEKQQKDIAQLKTENDHLKFKINDLTNYTGHTNYNP